VSCWVIVIEVGDGGSWVGGWSWFKDVAVGGWSVGFIWGSSSVLVSGRGDLDSVVASGRVVGWGRSVGTSGSVSRGVPLGTSCRVVVTEVGEGGSWVGGGSWSMGVVVEGRSLGSMGVMVEGWSSEFLRGSLLVLVLGRGDLEVAAPLGLWRVLDRGRSIGTSIRARRGVPLGTW